MDSGRGGRQAGFCIDHLTNHSVLAQVRKFEATRELGRGQGRCPRLTRISLNSDVVPKPPLHHVRGLCLASGQILPFRQHLCLTASAIDPLPILRSCWYGSRRWRPSGSYGKRIRQGKSTSVEMPALEAIYTALGTSDGATDESGGCMVGYGAHNKLDAIKRHFAGERAPRVTNLEPCYDPDDCRAYQQHEDFKAPRSLFAQA